MFRNAQGRVFQDVTTTAGVGHLQKGHAIALGDIDNDGYLDIYTVMGGFYPGDVYQKALFLNPGFGNHWITLELEGVDSNRAAIGARIKVRVESGDQARDVYTTVSTGGSFGSSSLRRVIGLGQATSIRSIEVTWPTTGRVQVFKNVAVDQMLKLREGDSVLRPLRLKRLDLSPQSTGSVADAGHRHD
jgi:hypothetical protein